MPGADASAGPQTDRRRLETAGVPALVVLLTALAAGPLVSGALADGPGRLLGPRESSVGVGALILLWLVFVWPAFQRDRSPSAVLRIGVLLLLSTLPVLAGAALASGVGLRAAAMAGLLVASLAFPVGAWLSGAGRSGTRDRFFAAGAAAVLFVAPLANYALNEFSGVAGDLGYRVSPIQSVRRILMGLPGADPSAASLVGLGAGALLLAGSGVRRRAGAAVLLLVLAGVVRGEELRVRPLLGGSYVPGRALPLWVEGGGGTGDVVVAVEGAGEFSAPARAGGTLVFIPGSAAPGPLRVRSAREEVEVSLAARPLAPGRPLVVALGPVPAEEVRFGESRGFGVSLATRGLASAEALTFLSADAVWDPGGLLPEDVSMRIGRAGVPVIRNLDGAGLARVAAARGALRRPWQEEGRILEGEDLLVLFRPETTTDRGRSVTSFLLTSGFVFLLLTGLRFAVRRGIRPLAVLGGVFVLSGAAIAGMIVALPPPPGFVLGEVSAAEGERGVRVVRVAARETGDAVLEFPSPPLALGRGVVEVRRDEEGTFCLVIPLRARQSCVVVTEGFGSLPAPVAPDLFFGPSGLAAPGGEPVSAGEFLRRYASGGDWEARLKENAIRKLLRLAAPPAAPVGVRLPTPERAVLEIVPE